MNRNGAARLCAGISLLALCGAPTYAFSQERPSAPNGPQQPAASDEATGLDEIVVTARRRNITQVSDIQKSVPSLVYEATAGNSSDARIFVRGVGNYSPNVSADAGVGVYIDGVYFGRSQGALINNLDIASIEILRGPQGTLFGRNTIGGAININSAKPSTDALFGTLEGGYGSFDFYRTRGTINVPVNDNLAIRLAALRERNEGYSVNDVDGRRLDNIDVWAFTAALRYTPTDAITFDANVMYTDDGSNGRAANCIAVAPNPVLGAAFPPACAATSANGIHHTRSDLQQSGAVQTLAASSTLAWDFGRVGALDNLTLKAIVGYQNTNSQRVLDIDGTELRGLWSVDDHRQTSQTSQEIQALGRAFDGRLNFVIGAYASREYTPGTGYRYSGTYPQLDDSRPIPLGNVRLTRLHNDSQAVYSQATFDFNSILSVTGGVRYTAETKGFFMQKYAVRDDARNVQIGPYTTNGLYVQDYSTTTPMGSIQLNAPQSWTGNGVLDRGMVYFTASKGFKSGGFNGNGDGIADNLTPYEPEQVDNLELGAKFSLFGRRLIGAIAGYDMRYKDIQLSVQGFAPTSGVTTVSVFNAGGATIRGVEIELQALLFDSLRASFNADFTDAEYTRFDDTSVPGGSRVGEPLAFIPEYHVSGAIENRFDLGGGFSVTPRVQVTRTADRYLASQANAAIRELVRVPAYTLVDASLKFELPNDVSVDLYGKNIFDTEYFNDALPTGFGVLRYYAPPASYGVTVRYRF